jgi:hypothetical protein
MIPSVKNWKIAIVVIDVVFAMVACDLVWVAVSTPGAQTKSWTFGSVVLIWLVAYLGFRSFAKRGKKKAVAGDILPK